jgi:hypothetical protein
MRWQSLIPEVRKATGALIVTLVVVFLLVGIGQGWLHLPLLQFFALVPGSLTWQSLIAWPLHVLYTPASNGFGLIFSLFVLAWMLGALEQRFGSKRVWQLTLLVALLPGLVAFLVGMLLTALFGTAPIAIAGSAPIAIAAAALGIYLVRHQTEVYLFSAMRITPTQLFGLLFGLAVLNLVISRSIVHFVEELAAIGSGVLFGRWLERGTRSPRVGPRMSGTKLRVVRGGDRTLH